MDHDLTPERTKVAPEPNSADLTLRYYQVLKQDQLLHINGFKNRVRYGQIIGTALAGLLASFLHSSEYSLKVDTVHLWIWVTVAITTATYFLIHDVLESVFAVKALDEYLSYLEERAEILGINGLFWQSGVAQNLWPTSFNRIGFPPPERCLGAYALCLIIGVTIVLPYYVYSEAWHISQDQNQQGIATTVVGVSLYAVVSFAVIIWVSIGVNGRLRSKVRHLIDERSRNEIGKTLNNPKSRIKYK
jgi:hypothetical protein